MNRVQLKGSRDRKILERLAHTSNGSTNGSVNGAANSNSNGRAQVAKKKAPSKRVATKQDAEITEPVTVRVFRTVKKEGEPFKREENSHGDQETPNQKPGEVGDDPDLETIEVRKFVTEPARVSFKFDVGRNTHFQSASVGVTVSIPCYVEEIEDAAAEAKRIVLDRVRPEMKDLDATLDYLVRKRIKADLRIPELTAEIQAQANARTAKKGEAT